MFVRRLLWLRFAGFPSLFPYTFISSIISLKKTQYRIILDNALVTKWWRRLDSHVGMPFLMLVLMTRV